MKWCRKESALEPSLEQQQAEKLGEIGAELRQARQVQGLSIETVAAKTLIQRRLLRAIESGSLEELPEPIYVQSFIKQYANALGIDGKTLAKTFPTGDRQIWFKPASRILPAAQLRPIHLYFLYLLLILWGVNTLSQTLNRTQMPTNSVSSQPVAPVDINAQSAANIKAVSSPDRGTDNRQVKISVTFKAQSWIRVVADGKTEFEGILPQGTQRTWRAEQELTLKTENAGGVLVQFNQQKPKQIGNPGQMQEVTFAANRQL